MATPVQYTKAPIIEALIDIQVVPQEGVDVTKFEEFTASIQESYPTKVDVIHFNAQFNLQPGNEPSSQAQRNHLGYMWIDRDQRNSFQARMNGFTFRRLAPYSNWDAFSGETRNLWSIYRRLYPNITISRVALKYTNRLDIPIPVRDFSDFLRTSLEISTDLPQSVRQMFLQFAIPLEQIDATAIITETLVQPVLPETCAIVLDIDIFKDQNVPQDEEELWGYIQHLREWKNKIFNFSTTERMKELIR